MRTRPPHLYQSGRGRPLYALHGRFQPSAILSFAPPMAVGIIPQLAVAEANHVR